MKAIFGVLSLVIVLAIVGSLAKKQLQAVDGGMAAAKASAASGAAVTVGAVPDVGGGTVRDQARGMQEKARGDTVRALEQGVERNQRADN